MQALFSCTPAALQDIQRTLSPARLSRYLPAANGNLHHAMRLYVWNAHLCAELYLPLQTAEITLRNVLHETLTRRYGAGWYSRTAFIDILPDRYKNELRRKVQDEQVKRQGAFTVNHVVAAMPLGFWVALLTVGFDHILWANGMRASFRDLPKNVGRQDVYGSVERLRHFRNKVAHHYAIFDRHPLDEYANALKVIGWASSDTQWLVRQLVNPQAMMAQRPRL